MKGEFSRLKIALLGNPNCGKTTIFNFLTGDHQAVGNYSGVTVEKVEGNLVRDSVVFNITDLPGVYSLTSAVSKEEGIVRDYLMQENPDVIVNIVDVSNFERNLFLTLQLKELGIPLVLVLNMCDLAKLRGVEYNLEKINKYLNIPIIEVIGINGKGLENLPSLLLKVRKEQMTCYKSEILKFSEEIETEISAVVSAIDTVVKQTVTNKEMDRRRGVRWLLFGNTLSTNEFISYLEVKNDVGYMVRCRWLAIKFLEEDKTVLSYWNDETLLQVVNEAIRHLVSKDIPIVAKFAAERYGKVRMICKESVHNERRKFVLWTDKVDRILTHPLWGLLFFGTAMYVVFWLTFVLGNVPVTCLETSFEWLGNVCNHFWVNNPDSLLRSMIVDGIIGGVGGVLTFFPNIFILFVAISALEESGYMARGAFLTDRFLRKFGLSGKSFIPMLVGFGCSVPAVMATRIIEDRCARLSTIFIIPLMSCGARFPIYVLIIPAFFTEKWQAPVLWCVYFIGIVIAAVISTVLSSTKFRNERNPFLLELPTYHWPTLHIVGMRAFERGWLYLRKAGTTILGVSLVLWFMSTFPRLPSSTVELFNSNEVTLQVQASEIGINLNDYQVKEEQPCVLISNDFTTNRYDVEKCTNLLEKWKKNKISEAETQLEYSIAGRIGKAMEPIIKNAGFDWRIGTALIGAMAAKEVFVAQLGIIFKIGNAEDNSIPLREAFIKNYSPLVGVSIIIFCLIGTPCVATVVIVAKESSWGWALAQWSTLTVVGFMLAVSVFQLGVFFNIGF